MLMQIYTYGFMAWMLLELIGWGICDEDDRDSIGAMLVASLFWPLWALACCLLLARVIIDNLARR